MNRYYYNIYLTHKLYLLNYYNTVYLVTLSFTVTWIYNYTHINERSSIYFYPCCTVVTGKWFGRFENLATLVIKLRTVHKEVTIKVSIRCSSNQSPVFGRNKFALYKEVINRRKWPSFVTSADLWFRSPLQLLTYCSR